MTYFLYTIGFNKFVDVLADDNIIQKKEYDKLICIAKSSHPCTYTWKYMYGNEFITVSPNQTFIPQQNGLYKCEAECLLRGQRCTVVAMVVQVSSVESKRQVVFRTQALLCNCFPHSFCCRLPVYLQRTIGRNSLCSKTSGHSCIYTWEISSLWVLRRCPV